MKLSRYIHRLLPAFGIKSFDAMLSFAKDCKTCLKEVCFSVVDEISEDESIIKIMLIDEPDVLDKAIAKLPKEVGEKYNLAKSTPYFFEIINKESNKGLGLKALADYLNVDKDEIIAVGDAGNDLDMIEFAGLGVAMENGHSNVKEAANYITKSNNEDGVAEVVKKFILK